jgi:hypothetical protein
MNFTSWSLPGFLSEVEPNYLQSFEISEWGYASIRLPVCTHVVFTSQIEVSGLGYKKST